MAAGCLPPSPVAPCACLLPCISRPVRREAGCWPMTAWHNRLHMPCTRPQCHAASRVRAACSHEGEGSAFALLKARGWAAGLVAGEAGTSYRWGSARGCALGAAAVVHGPVHPLCGSMGPTRSRAACAQLLVLAPSRCPKLHPGTPSRFHPTPYFPCPRRTHHPSPTYPRASAAAAPSSCAASTSQTRGTPTQRRPWPWCSGQRCA